MKVNTSQSSDFLLHTSFFNVIFVAHKYCMQYLLHMSLCVIFIAQNFVCNIYCTPVFIFWIFAKCIILKFEISDGNFWMKVNTSQSSDFCKNEQFDCIWYMKMSVAIFSKTVERNRHINIINKYSIFIAREFVCDFYCTKFCM
jgi:hypothetical protein